MVDRWYKNREFLNSRQDKYPHQCKTGKGLHPEHVEAKLGVRHMRVPFGDHCVWGFETEADLEAFKREFPGELRN